MNERDKVIVSKIIAHCKDIEKTHEFFGNYKTLFTDKEEGVIYRNAITMPILQIGELAKQLSEDFLNNHKEIPWKMIIRMRDVVAHHYGSLDFEMVWNTSKGDIQELKTILSGLEVDKPQDSVKNKEMER